MANFITASRVLLALLVCLMLNINPLFNLAATLLIPVTMLLDALDGYVARHLETSTLDGSVYDILADRMIENIFFFYFAALSLFSVWIAIVIMMRGLIIDAIRTIFASQGKTAFGANTLHTHPFTRFLACSKLSRGSYNCFKMITFVLFALQLQPQPFVTRYLPTKDLVDIGHFCLWITLVMSLIRALPVLVEGWFLGAAQRNKENH